VTLLWLSIRQQCLLKLKGAAGPTAKMLRAIFDTIDSYELLESFGKRDVAVDAFQQIVLGVQDVPVGKTCFLVNSTYFLKWLSPIMVSIWLIRDGPSVLAGEVDLGMFLAVIKIIHEVSQDCEVCYQQLMGMVKITKPLMRATVLLNLPGDLQSRKLTNRQRREETHARREKLATAPDAAQTTMKYDMLPIELMNLQVMLKGKNVFEGINASVEQGNIVALYGPQGCGKHTLMRLISLLGVPSSGKVFIPQHLKAVFVSNSVVLKLSAYKNLTFGIQANTAPDHNRIRRILTRLHMTKILGFVKRDLELPPTAHTHEPEHDEYISWIDSLADTDCRMLSIARAFISNPEVLLLEKPFHHFGEVEETMVADSMKELVQERGLCMATPNDGKNRRPRTVFYSTGREEKTKFADVVWHLLPVGSSEDGAHYLKVKKSI